MTSAFDSNVDGVAAEAVSGEILAAGWFHVHADDGLQFGGGLGLVATGVRWALRKQPWRWPTHAYWVVTADELWVLDLTVGSAVRLRKVVGRWKRAAVTTTVGSAPNRAVVQVPARPSVEIEGDRYEARELEVLALLRASA